jgi:hypothetical protein
MKKNLFIVELIKSPPFLIFIILALAITIGVILANRKEKVVQMKEDVLYIKPKSGEKE